MSHKCMKKTKKSNLYWFLKLIFYLLQSHVISLQFTDHILLRITGTNIYKCEHAATSKHCIEESTATSLNY